MASARFVDWTVDDDKVGPQFFMHPSPSSLSSAPLSRQFWKAGNYDEKSASKVSLQTDGKNHLSVHPMFLHSNATSHTWAFGAIAELLDNVMDEVQNGATFVLIDKVKNPRDGSATLLVQDDGSGMDPQAIRHCLSFGFSGKKLSSTIGKYGNGFKTSSMRLGADVIVFSRHVDNGTCTQSIGLLSYTFLTKAGLDRIVVPIVDYELSSSTGRFEVLNHGNHYSSNMSVVLNWSPYSTEAELLNQFDNIGAHGTKIIIYNLWFDSDGTPELKFDLDPRDIQLGQAGKSNDLKATSQQHISCRFRYSLRIPQGFRIVLRGQDVEHHNIADDLKFLQYILYKPQSYGSSEAIKVVTTIGFLKEAPQINSHGFCVYHKNRLILVASCGNSRGRGVVGVLEANFVEPAHNKQDFEKTSLLQKLESRLKQMAFEYWDYHCGLIGYTVLKKVQMTTCVPVHPKPREALGYLTTDVSHGASSGRGSMPCSEARAEQGLCKRRIEDTKVIDLRNFKRQAGEGDLVNPGIVSRTQPINIRANQLKDQEAIKLMQEHQKLQTRCSEYETRKNELNLRVLQLKKEIGGFQSEYERLFSELQALAFTKDKSPHVPDLFRHLSF